MNSFSFSVQITQQGSEVDMESRQIDRIRSVSVALNTQLSVAVLTHRVFFLFVFYSCLIFLIYFLLIILRFNFYRILLSNTWSKKFRCL